MAANTEEVNWASCVKPLLAASYSALSKNDLPTITDCINKSEKDILDHSNDYEAFYSSYVALSAHYICASCTLYERSDLNQAIDACRILIRFLLKRLQVHNDNCTIAPKYLMMLLQGLCRARSSLPKSDVLTFTAMLKSAKLPPSVKTDSDTSIKKEAKRPRIDTSSGMFDHMTSVFTESSTTSREQIVAKTSLNQDGDITISHMVDPSEEIPALLSARNTLSLQEVHGSDILLDVCAKLPHLARYMTSYQEAMAGSGFLLPSNVADAITMRSSLHSVLNDISIVWRAFSLPMLEPLTSKRLDKVVAVAMSCLYASLSVAASNSILNLAHIVQVKGLASGKEEEAEGYAANIVQKALEIFNCVSLAIRNSTRAGGQHLQNLHLIGAWCILRGLQHVLTFTPSNIMDKFRSRTDSKGASNTATSGGVRGKESTPAGTAVKTKESSRPTSAKMLHGFGVFCVALASQAIDLMTGLMDDVAVESQVTMVSGDAILKEISISESYTAWQRVQILTESVELSTLMYTVLSVAYRKAASLRKPGCPDVECESGSSSDSNTYYEDDFSSSDDSSDDEGSDSILGHWFEDIVSPSDTTDTPPAPPPPNLERSPIPGGKKARRPSNSDAPNFVPDKKSPEGFICLAADILRFMTRYFLGSSCPRIRQYLRKTACETHMVSLAQVTREADRHQCTTQQSAMFQEFSAALASFSHGLISSDVLSNDLQDTLLSLLGVNPNAVEPWPLTIHVRTLAVFLQIMLLRQQQERTAQVLKSKTEAAVINVWVRFMTTLKSAILKYGSEIADYEDVNVEHFQVLVFLFHGLPLLQKKSVLLQLANCVVTLAEMDRAKLERLVPLPMSRLILIVDYLLRNFYDPSADLMTQVQGNLFVIPSGGKVQDSEKSSSSNVLHFSCREVEESYWKNATIAGKGTADSTMCPRFYNLGITNVNSQDNPRVDGLACSFLLGTPDILDYAAFYKACITLLLVGSRLDQEKTMDLLDAASLHYHLSICWRLLGCLPPSVGFLHLLQSGCLTMDQAMILHTLRWAPRLAHKAYATWTKDFLVKQGLTTQQADALVTGAMQTANNAKYDVRLVLQHMQEQLAITPASSDAAMTSLPSFHQICMLDTILAKVQVSLDEAFTQAMAETDPQKSMDIALDLLPSTVILIEAHTTYIRSTLLNQITQTMDSPCTCTPEALRAYSAVLSIGSTRPAKTSSLALSVLGWLPPPVKNTVEKWNLYAANEFPAVGSWRNAFANDIIPSESYLDAIYQAHLATLSSQPTFCLNASLKHILQALTRFCGDLVMWCSNDTETKKVVKILFPLVFHATTENVGDHVITALERITGSQDSEEFIFQTYEYVINVCYDLLVNHSHTDSGLDEHIFYECLRFMENLLDSNVGKKVLKKIFSGSADLVNIVLTASHQHLSPVFCTKVLKFFNKLFQLAEKHPGEEGYKTLCSSLTKLAHVQPSELQAWLGRMIMGPLQTDEESSHVQENRVLLQSLTTYIVKEHSYVGEEVARAILKSLIPMGSELLSPVNEGTGFAELMVVMATLAGAGSGLGHASLFQAATGWLELCKTYLAQEDVIERLKKDTGDEKSQAILESTCYLLSYVGDILMALKKSTERSGATSPPYDTDAPPQDHDSDWAEEIAPEEEDSAAEDSDEETLNSKLCTFSVTQKEFMNQHWYHCHTCKMTDRVGVCSVCAKVCHKDHDVTYAKFGSFFCDCGAKEDGTCQALVKRLQTSGLDSTVNAPPASPFSMDTMLHSSIRKRMTTPDQSDKESGKVSEQVSRAKAALCRQIEGCRETLMAHSDATNAIQVVLDLLNSLMPPIMENYQKTSPVGSTMRAQNALHDLHTQRKNVTTSDQLMTATLGSQEGAFENVRITYTGDQGQQIRQLITSHVLRRVAMCCMTSPQGKRQHLAVSHEKGKITILQLSALLKQADSSKRKLTLTRLSSAPIPFTALSITGNPCNEDFLAVCGLKDCHVLTFNSSGNVADHLVLHPALETGNFIIKAVWLPGSQTAVAIVTADFVKVYDLSLDAISPQYYFLLPSGKIRDVTFLFTEDSHSLLLMTSAGYIYSQIMEAASSAVHGPFYITNVIEVKHNDLKESSGQVAGGGASIYYSHAMQLVVFSYCQGKTFLAPVPKSMDQMKTLFPVPFKSNGGKSNSGSALVQWSEVPSHPGLFFCMSQASNNPVVLMVKPDSVQVQEIKVLPAKAKIQDMVAIRHAGANSDQRTTMILLCEDGSLRIYMANIDTTNYWMSPMLQPQSAISVLKPTKKKKSAKTGRQVNNITFPVDFFEHCQASTDIEFGGNDVLQVYNVQQVKNRLNTDGMYIASTKQSGFTLEINNSNTSNVIVGIRVQVGSQTLDRAPSYLEVFGRNVPISGLSCARWIDLPLTRDESLGAARKLALFVGPSSDPSSATMIDSVKVYVKSKEVFGWPEETEEFQETTTGGSKAPIVPGLTTQRSDPDSNATTPVTLTIVDRLLATSLEVLDGCFAMVSEEDRDRRRQAALDLATTLLTLPTPVPVQQQTKALMSSLFPNKTAYHNHKDHAQLTQVIHCLTECREANNLDPEAFQRLVVTARSLAVTRPANLVRFADKECNTLVADDSDGTKVTDLETSGACTSEEGGHFISQLMAVFWRLWGSRPSNPAHAPVCLPGLTHVEATVGALVEIIHAFTTCDLEMVTMATKLYVRLLLSEDSSVAFACKQAMIRVLRPKHRRRKVFIPSPPRCSTPGQKEEDKTPQRVSVQSIAMEREPSAPDMDDFEIYEESQMLEPSEPEMPPNVSPLEALLAHGGPFPPMLDIPPDADDEAMVDLAIALSLQEQGSGTGGLAGLQALSLAGQHLQVHSGEGSSVNDGQYSDTTASAPGSDDEAVSTAATDGSTLRTSPAEHGGSGGSESDHGSAVDSISGEQNVSGRSSAYGDTIQEAQTAGARSETSSLGMPSASIPYDRDANDPDADTGFRLHTLRMMLLEKLIEYIPQLKEVGGVRAIPFMQVVLMLTSDMDSDEDKDRAALDNLLTILLKQLDMGQKDNGQIAERSNTQEVRLIIMRLLSVFMSRTRAGAKPTGESFSFLSTSTSAALLTTGAIEFCLQALRALLDYWKKLPVDEEGGTMPGQLLKPHPTTSPPDMSPFFLRQYVKGHANDVFESYPQLLTEMILRLPYQMKKIADVSPNMPSPAFEQAWFFFLCEYMMTQQTPFVKRQVRKLLLFICGSKEKYRLLRDLHALESHVKEVKAICSKYGFDELRTAPVNVPYDFLITLIEHLKACSDVATSRTGNWQKFCHKNDNILSFLIQASILLDEGVAPVLLQLLQCALCGAKGVPGHGTHTFSPTKSKKDKEKEKDSQGEDYQPQDEGLSIILVQQVNKLVERDLLVRFMRAFLLESNSTTVRWQAHALVLHIYRNSSQSQQEALLELMWNIWPELPGYGRKAAQFVDLLGYFALKTQQASDKKMTEHTQKAVDMLRGQNEILANHQNTNIYNQLQGLVEFDGYFLESDPCLVCNNPEIPFTNIKLSAIKVDSKFTTTTQIVKLVGSHTISKVTVKISDLKRTKMVRVMNIFYNNRTVQAVVELKNKPGLWHKAKKVNVTAGQTEIKVEFPLPIVACNLMIEYADFYDNFQASAETLQCPRCSASVPANPGVCGNCGENVFQCHKCRSINYDEKDPFLCNACGFCKYAKFDFTLTARPCCAVDPIENEEDRKKAISSINTLQEKADRLYKQLHLNRPALEALLIRVNEQNVDKDDLSGPGTSGASNVNRAIQQLAMRYSGDCKSTFDELSKVIQRVLASRRELVEYDRKAKEAALASVACMTPLTTPDVSPRMSSSTLLNLMSVRSLSVAEARKQEGSHKHCYDCSSSAVEHCITLLRALATNTTFRQILCTQGLLDELFVHNLRHGPANVRSDVRQLICLLIKDNFRATESICRLIVSRVMDAINNHLRIPDLGAMVRHEMLLLVNAVQKEDSCWEQRVRCVMQLFLLSLETKSPVVTDNITLPCLRILQLLVKPDPPTTKKHKDKSIGNICTVNPGGADLRNFAEKWITSDPTYTFNDWKKMHGTRKPVEFPLKKKKESKPEVRARYLMEKFGGRWLDKMKKMKLGGEVKGHVPAITLTPTSSDWLRRAFFSPSVNARVTATHIVETMAEIPARRMEMLDLMTGFLSELSTRGEHAIEFLQLYKRLMAPLPWKYYLALKKVLMRMAGLITKEVEKLSILEETTLTSDLSQGYALKAYTDLMSIIMEQEPIKQVYKSRLVGTILNGYLSLRKLVVQRTKLIDDTQEKLLDLLEDLTTGTDSETKEFMSVCVETVKKYGLDDLRSPVFIFERLCSIIFPEENDTGEFFMSLEKDPQQEDFLQGRMLGNPYSSNEHGLGPLMRDVKNKICQDCELVALLEDDTGMELLVNNKIISLDLPVKDVYKKVWSTDHSENDPMRVVYRMRGLLGDATEDMVNSLDSSEGEDIDNEEVYKMAGVMSECGGLQVILHRMAAIRDMVHGRQLITVLLKLFNYCMKVKVNRIELIKPEMRTISVMLGALNLALLAEQGSGISTKGQTLTEQILHIMEIILLEASSQPPEQYTEFSKQCSDAGQLTMLLDRINSPFVRANTGVLEALMRLIPFLSFGEDNKMMTLINHFQPYQNFEMFDAEHKPDEEIHLECFCVITNGIQENANGSKLKDMILDSGIVKDALAYIKKHSPPIKTLLATDSEDWKDFIAKPSLKYLLRFMTGMCKGHSRSQVTIGADLISVLHKLEQISSDEQVGSLAENLMEALKQNKQVAAKIEEVRQQTKQEKKRLAMAMRKKQLGALGMTTNEKGQVTVESSVMKEMEELKEETGLTCCICREGYRYQPTKVLGIYTFTKRACLEEFENKPRKTQGCSTVSHFNLVHVDCHMAAVRLARGREEWQSAALQNANTRCNGLLPLWGPEVPESAFANCLARHNTYLQECTGLRDTNYTLTTHDIKLLLMRFAFERSFSEDTRGGGRQSNMHLVPHMIHMALYVLNTTRMISREEKNVGTFIDLSREKWLETAFEVDGPFYWSVMAVLVLPRDKWNEQRVHVLKRLLVTAQARHVMQSGSTSLSDKSVKEYSVYKPYLVFFSLIDGIINTMLKRATMGSDGTWSSGLADHIRRDDNGMLDASDKLLKVYEEEMLLCESFSEFCDVIGLLGAIPDPDSFLKQLLSSM